MNYAILFIILLVGIIFYRIGYALGARDMSWLILEGNKLNNTLIDALCTVKDKIKKEKDNAKDNH